MCRKPVWSRGPVPLHRRSQHEPLSHVSRKGFFPRSHILLALLGFSSHRLSCSPCPHYGNTKDSCSDSHHHDDSDGQGLLLSTRTTRKFQVSFVPRAAVPAANLGELWHPKLIYKIAWVLAPERHTSQMYKHLLATMVC